MALSLSHSSEVDLLESAVTEEAGVGSCWEARRKIRHITYLAIALLITLSRLLSFTRISINSRKNEGRRLLLSLHRFSRCLFAGEDSMGICHQCIKMDSYVDTKIGELCCGNFDGSFFTRSNLSCPTLVFLQFHTMQCTG